MTLITELPHGSYSKGEINAIDFRIEDLPIPDNKKKALTHAFLTGKGIIGKMPKSGKLILFTPRSVKVLKDKPKDKTLILPLNWQKYAVILKDNIELKEMIRRMVREILQEKWSNDIEIKSTGEHADKTVTNLRKELETLKGKKPYDREKAGELMFAIRAKTGWEKGEGAVGSKK